MTTQRTVLANTGPGGSTGSGAICLLHARTNPGR